MCRSRSPRRPAAAAPILWSRKWPASASSPMASRGRRRYIVCRYEAEAQQGQGRARGHPCRPRSRLAPRRPRCAVRRHLCAMHQYQDHPAAGCVALPRALDGRGHLPHRALRRMHWSWRRHTRTPRWRCRRAASGRGRRSSGCGARPAARARPRSSSTESAISCAMPLPVAPALCSEPCRRPAAAHSLRPAAATSKAPPTTPPP